MNRFPPSRILVPLDFSEPSLAALEDAKQLARRFGASLDLLYVQPAPMPLTGFPAEGLAVPEITKQLSDFRKWRVEQMRKAIADFPSARARVRSLEGWPPKEIAEIASGGGMDLVVMGTHGYAGMDRALFGSVAEAVVRRSKAPVLCTHPKSARLKVTKILAPFNMTEYAAKALEYGLRWAHRLGARLSPLYVAPEGFPENIARDVVAQRLRPLLGRHADRQLLLRWGEPREQILEAAARGGFDLIVLSAHRKPLLGDWVLGSTAERVLRHSPVPVLSVPSVAAKRGRREESLPWITNKLYGA